MSQTAGSTIPLAPHNGEIVVLLALLYKLLDAIFGLGSQLPFRLVLGVTLAGLGLLVFGLVRERLGNAIACSSLVCATLLFNLGIPFVVGTGIVIALRRRPAQLWIVGVPAALFVIWWTFYGHRQPAGVSSGNIAHLPRYLLDSISMG